MNISVVQLFKCLSEETRLNSTLLIHLEGEVCVCELVETLGESQSKISRHLSQLRNCGILTDRRTGQWVFYSLHPDFPEWGNSVLGDACIANAKELKGLRARLNALKDRPNRC